MITTLTFLRTHPLTADDTRSGTDFIPDWHIPDEWWSTANTEVVLIPNIGFFEATTLEPADIPTKGAEYIAQTKFRRELACQFSLLGLGVGSRNIPRRDVRLDVISTVGNPDWDDLLG